MPKLPPLEQIIAVAPGWPILEHQHQRPSSASVRTAGQEITADESFKNTRLAAALRADDGDVGKGDLRSVAGGSGQDVLEFVDDRDE